MQLIFLLMLTFVLLPSAAQQRLDIIIDEIMADPSPQVGLPNYEWVELRNNSAAPVNLQGWRISDPTGQSGPMPAFLLQPDSLVIVCGTGAAASLSAFGRVISVTSFPSLDNDGDIVFLKSAGGAIIHAVQYSIGWYDNPLKKDGGWTLEMIDTRYPCLGAANWRASTDPAGGTPGRINSVQGTATDTDPPQLLNAYFNNNGQLMLVFDEPLDSLVAATAHYRVDPPLLIHGAQPQPPLFNSVLLSDATPDTGTIYTVYASGIADCQGNMLGSSPGTRAAITRIAGEREIVINEILFNPRPGAYDYVELYHRGPAVADAAQLYIANRNSSGIISNSRRLSTVPLLFFPGDYLVITQDASSLSRHYFVRHPQAVIALSSLPSFPDDKGVVVLHNSQGQVIDEVPYQASWHFDLIADKEGVALERIDPAGSSQDRSNWHSASSTAGYGTPTYKNSQYRMPVASSNRIIVAPKIFSPDNDGMDDIVQVIYQLDQPGYVANITIFDAGGVPVCHLVRNSLMGRTGYYNWNGLNDKGQRLPVGLYIILTDLFDLNGKKQRFKNSVVLTRRL